MDEEGELPVYIDGCYVITQPRQVPEALKELKRFNSEFNTEHLKVHTLKIFNDGTLKIETAALVTHYEDTGDKYHVKVTCAHLEIQDDADIDRFAKLGVNANYTPWWHAGNMGGNPYDTWSKLLGESRAKKMYRCKSVWKTGANVTWSSDDIHYGDFNNWSPYLGMEVGMTRWINEKTRASEIDWTVGPNPSPDEQMTIEEMIIGYTINGAKQLGIEDKKGSIEAGKDADFLVFDNDLLTAKHEGFSYNKPADVYFAGRKVY